VVPRLIATDLDGTLVRGDRTISARTAATLRAASEAGVQVVLVTGRPIRWLSNVYGQLAAEPLAICANGAAVYDPATDSILHEAPLDPPVLREAVARLRAAVPAVAFAVEHDGGRTMVYEPGYPVGAWEIDRTVVVEAPLSRVLARPAAKLLARCPDRDWAGTGPSDEFTELVRSCLAGLAEATHSSSSGLVEISAVGVTKAYGLAWVAARLGVPAAEVVAFGDMPNDLAMLAWAGRGVAVANGHRSVLDAADEVTGTVDDDGVASYLERILDRAAR
jgi:hydroxymethylpyrimidine pyrophosphatase-like HAD family hydrolase